MKNIICFGDSLTEGWINGGKSFYPYTNKLQTLLDEEKNKTYLVINKGLSGERVYLEMRERLQKVLQDFDEVEFLILQGGTNDILTLKQLQDDDLDLFDEFKKLFEIAKTNNVKNICLLTTIEGYYTEEDDAVMTHEESNKLRLEFNKKLREHAYANPDVFVLCDIADELPFFDLNRSEAKKKWDDKIHPSVLGYECMAEIIHNHIKRFL